MTKGVLIQGICLLIYIPYVFPKPKYHPFILHMEEIAALIPTEKCKVFFCELIDKLRSRCDNRYATGKVVASTFLFDDEMAELTTHMAFLLLLVEPVKNK